MAPAIRGYTCVSASNAGMLAAAIPRRTSMPPGTFTPPATRSYNLSSPAKTGAGATSMRSWSNWLVVVPHWLSVANSRTANAAPSQIIHVPFHSPTGMSPGWLA